MEHENHNDIDKEKISPETCVEMGKCIMADMIKKMSEKEYMSMPDEEKDKEDEKEVMGHSE